MLVMRSGMEARRLAPMSLSFKNPLTILRRMVGKGEERIPHEGSSSARESLPRQESDERGRREGWGAEQRQAGEGRSAKGDQGLRKRINQSFPGALLSLAVAEVLLP